MTPQSAVSDYASARRQVAALIDRMLAEEPLPGKVLPAVLGAAVRAYPERAGKRLRPALLLWSCQLCGGDPVKARHAALAVELYHNWTLVHDDIIDRDETRRGQPACHALLRDSFPGPRKASAAARHHGCSQAILAGDIQHGWSVDALARCAGDGVRPEVVITLVRLLCGQLTPALISGEALDVEFAARRHPPPPAEIERMIALKTGALLRFAAQAGALIGLDATDPGRREVRDLGDFAENAGVAFQLWDDWLGVFGDSAELGKPVGSDLREGKKTLLLSLALEKSSGAGRREIRALVSRKNVGDKELNRVRQLLRECGAETGLLTCAGELADAARRLLHGFPVSPARDLLDQWLDALVHRTR